MDFPTETWGDDAHWMELALREAAAAADTGEVPVGCVIVKEGRILGRGHNRVEVSQDPTAHAEILAISAATETVGSWRLLDAIAYVTCEPCMMCMGAFHLARVSRVVYGAREPKFGACGSRLDLTGVDGLNHTLCVEGGLLADESAELLRRFFCALRERGKKTKQDGANGRPL
jgi:tRNA(adenine34) deaminase